MVNARSAFDIDKKQKQVKSAREVKANKDVKTNVE